MKSRIMKKEEEVAKLEEEVVTLRSKIVKVNKNVEETEISTSIIENENKHSMLLEKKNEENRKSYVEVLKGRNHGQPESKKTIEDTFSRRPQRRPLTPRYANFFYGHCFYCTNFGNKVAYWRDYKRNVQTRNAYVAPRNIECYKFHNYGHIASDCRSMIDTSMKENINIIYKKSWIRKHEEQVNKDQVLEIVRLEIKQDEENSTEKRKDVRYRKV
jgi:hypothetical protein